MTVNQPLDKLKQCILVKSGLSNISPAYCKTISEYVFRQTKNHVSETTIKRFFGFANTQHKFSLFTLNSLSQYVGYSSWQSFCNGEKIQVPLAQSDWQVIKLKAQAITNITLIAKKNNSGVPFSSTSNRSFLYPDFDYFLKKDYQFTAFSAAPGQGKSILLTHLVEHFFYSEQAKYQNDIVLFINITNAITNNSLQNGILMQDFFLKEFNYKGLNALLSYFKNNPEKREGKFILVFDCVDTRIPHADFLKFITSLLLSTEENNFVKIIFGLRTNSWNPIQEVVSNSAFLTKYWYKGLFYNQETSSNVPPLNVDEILHTLSYIKNKPLKAEQVNSKLLTLFKTPFWLHIYFKFEDKNLLLDLDNPLLYYQLVHYYLEKGIFLSEKSTEKTFLLKKISQSIFYKNGFITSKIDVLRFANAYADVYNTLLFENIIIEEKKIRDGIPEEVVRFSNRDIYTYFIFIQKKEKYSDDVFFEYILENFPSQSIIRENLLIWSIRYYIGRNELAKLKAIFSLPFTHEEKNNSLDFICHFSNYELQKTDSKFNNQSIGKDFIDIMVNSQTMSKFYKETIKNISNNVLNEEAQIMLNILEINICLTDFDKAGIQNIQQLLKKNSKKLTALFPINLYDLVLYFHHTLCNKPFDNEALENKIMKFCCELEKSSPLKNEKILTSEILTYQMVLLALFSQKKYTEHHRFISAILKKYPMIFYMRNSVLSSFLLIQLGQVYLKLNYYKKAQHINQFLDKIFESKFIYQTNFILSCYKAFKASFNNYTHNYKDAFNEADLGLKLAEKHDFKQCKVSLMLIKIESMKHLNHPEDDNATINELLKFISTNKISIPDYTNLNGEQFEHTFKILKSYQIQ